MSVPIMSDLPNPSHTESAPNWEEHPGNGPVKEVALWRKPGVLNLLIIALLAEIGYAALNLSTMPVYLKNDRHFGESVIGLVLTAFLLSEAIFKSVMGHYADRFGARTMMIAGPTLSVATSLLSLVVPKLGAAPVEVMAFVMLRALDGIAIAMLWPAAFAQMNAICSDKDRQEAMSLLNLCYMLGIALAFPVGGICNDLAKVTYAGLILSAVVFAGVAFAIYRLIDPKAHPVKAKDDEHGGGLKDFLGSMRQIPEYLMIAVVTFAGIGFPTYIFKIFPIDQFKMSETQIGALIFPGAIAMATLSVPMSKVGERIGRVRAVHYGLALCAIGMWVIGAGAFLPFLRSPIVLALGGIPVGIGFLLTIPAWMASVSDINPEKRASNIGAIMTAQGLGAILGAPVGAAMYEKLQPLGVQLGVGPEMGRYSPFVGCAVCVTLGWLLSVKVLHVEKPVAIDGLPQAADPTEAIEVVAAPEAPIPTVDSAELLNEEYVTDMPDKYPANDGSSSR